MKEKKEKKIEGIEVSRKKYPVSLKLAHVFVPT